METALPLALRDTSRSCKRAQALQDTIIRVSQKDSETVLGGYVYVYNIEILTCLFKRREKIPIAQAPSPGALGGAGAFPFSQAPSEIFLMVEAARYTREPVPCVEKLEDRIYLDNGSCLLVSQNHPTRKPVKPAFKETCAWRRKCP